MIVRIAGEDQFRLDGDAAKRVEELDQRLLEAVERGDKQGFEQLFGELLELVREAGKPLADDDLSSSDLILPPPDTTLEQARANFSGEGLLPEP